jgi:uncharacterized protein
MSWMALEPGPPSSSRRSNANGPQVWRTALDVFQGRTMSSGTRPQAEDASAVCRTCGACCSYSREWPRFSLENDAVLDRIPPAYIDDEHGRMRCDGDRCIALRGDVGVSTSCAVYAVRPDVCRACLPGDDACQTARRHFDLGLFARRD